MPSLRAIHTVFKCASSALLYAKPSATAHAMYAFVFHRHNSHYSDEVEYAVVIWDKSVLSPLTAAHSAAPLVV